MGKYKEIDIERKEKLKDKRIDIIDVILASITTASLLFGIYLSKENNKLLKQVDDADARYNELNSQYEQLDMQYDELQKDYDYAVDVIRSSDKYDMSEE